MAGRPEAGVRAERALSDRVSCQGSERGRRHLPVAGVSGDGDGPEGLTHHVQNPALFTYLFFYFAQKASRSTFRFS